jgi:aerobic carbon-monoxide dehydrogenase large subunit
MGRERSLDEWGGNGDTETSAFGFGTFATRSMVMASAAGRRASRILRERMLKIGVHLLQCDAAAVRCTDRLVLGPQGPIFIGELVKVAQVRPLGVEPLLEAVATYEPSIGTAKYPTQRMVPWWRSISRPGMST